jgi:hypothetical protein
MIPKSSDWPSDSRWPPLCRLARLTLWLWLSLSVLWLLWLFVGFGGVVSPFGLLFFVAETDLTAAPNPASAVAPSLPTAAAATPPPLLYLHHSLLNNNLNLILHLHTPSPSQPPSVCSLSLLCLLPSLGRRLHPRRSSPAAVNPSPLCFNWPQRPLKPLTPPPVQSCTAALLTPVFHHGRHACPD